MTKKYYIDILTNELTRNRSYFGFNDIYDSKELKYKLYQDNELKHKSLLGNTWVFNNCSKVIDTPAHIPDFSSIENVGVSEKRVAKRSRINKTALINDIQKEWNKIPLVYNQEILIHLMTRHLHDCINPNCRHTKY